MHGSLRRRQSRPPRRVALLLAAVALAAIALLVPQMPMGAHAADEPSKVAAPPADTSPFGDEAEVRRPTGPPAKDEGLPPASSEQVKDDAERHRAAQRRNEQRRKEPEQRAARARSRNAFGRLSDAEALKVTVDEQPSVFEMPMTPLFGLDRDDEIVSYLGDTQAVVDTGDGRRSLVDSTVPLRDADENGRKAPVDLALERRDGHLESANPLAAVTIDDAAGGAVRFPKHDVRLRLAPGAGAEPAELRKGSAFFANVERDTDLSVAAVPSGLRSFHVLRSQDSPERLPLRLELPAGARLENLTGRFAVDQPGERPAGAQVVKDGERLLGISAPRAWDADGQPVPVQFALRGHDYVIHVDHRGGDWKYPLVVDPEIVDFFQNWKVDGSVGFGNQTWRGYRDGSGRYWGGWTFDNPYGSPKFAGYMGDSYLGRGLYIYNRSNQYFGSGEFAQWLWWMPRGAYVYRADFAWLLHEAWANPNNCILTAGWSFGRWNWEPGTWWNWEPPSQTQGQPFMRCNNWYHQGWGHSINHFSEPQYENLAVFRNHIWGATWAQNFTTYTGGSIVWMRDGRAPEMVGQEIPGGWVNSNARLQVRGWDDGLGMKRLQLRSPATPSWSSNYTYESGCSGHFDGRSGNQRCSDWLNVTGYVNELAEGEAVPIEAVGTDIVQNVNTGRWHVNVDRSAPSLAIDGELHTNPYARTGTRSMTVTASGEGSTTSSSTKRSGVRTVRFYVDNVERDPDSDRPCPGTSCSATRSFSVDMGALAEGRHSLRVQATDWAGNVSTRRWKVIVDRGTPQMTALNGPVHDELFLRGASHRLHAEATDGITPAPTAATDERHEPDVRAGVKNAVLYLQDAAGEPWTERARWSRTSCSTGNCTLNADLLLDAASTAVRQGRHNVKLAVSDLADNTLEVVRRTRPGETTATPWETVIDRGTQRPVESGELYDRRGQLVDRPMTLHVEAPDGSTATRPEERSGMKTVELLVDGATVDGMPDAQRLDTASCPGGSCRISGDLHFHPGSVWEGWRTISLRVTDFVGNTNTYDLFRVLVDRGRPTVRHEPIRNVGGWHKDGDDAESRVIANDMVSGVKRIELHSPRLRADGTVRIDVAGHDIPCAADGQCPANVDVPRTFTYRGDDPARGNMPEGRNSLSGAAFDAAGLRSSPDASWAFRVDRTPPATEVSGSLKTAENTVLIRSAYELRVRATDGTRPANVNAPTPAERAQERSGVRSIDVFTRFEDPTKPMADWQWQRQDGSAEDCPVEGSCARGLDWTLRTREFPPGAHSVKVETRDQLGHLRTDEFRVFVGLRLGEPVDALGLEEWYQLDETQTGGESQAYVNLGTGNLVWHSTPIVNAGRSLASVVNLTYNSQRRSDDAGQALSDLTVTEVPLAHNEVGAVVNLAEPHGLRPDELPVGYSEAGQNVSLGISGVTRLNEPLDVTRALIGGPIELTDADGTHHVFEPADGSVAGIAADSYVGPPGVDLHLRRFSANKPNSMTIPGQLGLLEDPKRTWAMTRPDGVTHFFDQFGYQTFIVDRDGNTLEFAYENRSATGLVCDVVELPGANLPTNTPLCFRKLVAVVDAAGAGRAAGDAVRERRSIKLEYYSRGVVDTSVDPGTAQPQERPSGRLKAITDHAGRRTELAYAGGYLTHVDQKDAAGARLRDWKLGYEASDDPDRGGPVNLEPRYLETITDPRGGVTDVDYESRELLELSPEDRFSSRRVTSIRDRRDGKARGEDGEPTDLGTQYRILDEDDNGRRFVRTEVADARSACNLETQEEGERSTPCHVWRHRLDDRARLFDMRDARNTQALLTWNPENRLTRMVRAAGTPEASTTTSEYNHNGLLVSETDPAGTSRIDYEDSAGPRALRTPRGTDENGIYVSDAVGMTDKGGHRTSFTLDTSAEHVHKGRVVARRMPGVAAPATTEYDAATGLVVAETDEEGRRTGYPIEGYDESGLPRRTRDPKGGLWVRDFDAVGNMLRETDPRNGAASLIFETTPNATDVSFTKYVRYDGLDQPTHERAPKLTGSGTASERRWSERSWKYDPNGNLEFQVDAEGARTDVEYTPMDDPDIVRSPATAHAGEDGAVRELTDLSYDEEENPVEQDNEGGAAGDADDDRRTTMTYDEVNQLLTSTRHSSRPQDPARLVTSFAYDRRGNRVGLVDPARNARFGNDAAAANALVPERRRFTYEYDLADRPTAQVEDPGGLALRSSTEYDADGNVKVERDARGSRTTYDYNARDLATDIVRHVTDPTQEGTVERRTHREYYDDGRLRSVTSPRGTASDADGDFTTTMTYDELGQVETRTLPRAPGQYGPGDLRVEYERDAIGNPEWVTDARGHRFHNTFYDSGDLRTTQQPSFWRLEQTEDGEFAVGERSAQQVAALVEGRALPASEGHGDLGEVEQEQKPELLPRAGTPELLYDDEMRLSGVEEDATERNGDGTVTRYDSRIEVGRDPMGRVTRTAFPHDVRGQDGIGGNAHLVERYEFDRNGNLTISRAGTAAAVDGGGGVRTTAAYDGYDRVVSETQPPASDGGEGRTSTRRYDLNGNVTARTTPADDATWRWAYDAVDRQVGEQSPVRRTRDGETTTETTCFGYDRAGNRVWERDPRGNLPGVPGAPSGTAVGDLCDPAAQPEPGTTSGCATDTTPHAECFTTRRSFNATNELVRERDGHGHETTHRYDPNGNQVRTEEPGARASDGGALAPKVTCREFDGRDLPWTETTGVPEGTSCGSAGGSDGERTTVSEYDGNGNLVRKVNPAGVGDDRRPTTALGTGTPGSDQARNATVFRYSAGNQMQARLLPWDADDGEARWRQNFDLDARGRVERIAGPYRQGSDELTQITEYARYETGWIRRSREEADDPNLADDQDDPQAARGQVVSYEYDGRGNQTLYRSAIRRDGDDVERRRVERTYFQSDSLERRTASAPGDPTRTYTYGYDANARMTTMRDAQNGHTTHFSYDLADRSTRVNECWENGDDTLIAYDENGEIVERRTDGRYAGGDCDSPSNFTDGKTTTFTRDSMGRETRAVVDPEGSQGNRRFDHEFWPSGALRQRIKRRHAAGADEPWPVTVTDSYFYDRDGRLGRRVRDPHTGDSDTTDYRYDDNGNRTQDERGTHSFNARDQLVRWTRKDGDSHVRYGVNGAGAMTSKNDTKDGSSLTYRTIGDRIESLTVSQGGMSATFDYEHDDLGNVVRVSDTESPNDPESTVNYDYDPFNRLLGSRGQGIGGESSYTYDGLDRRDSERRGGRRYDLSYVGLSESLSQREGFTTASDGTSTASGTKRFDYDSRLSRLGMSSTDDGSTKYRSYATDANGSVLGLENDGDGSIAAKDRYEYDPYGELEKKPKADTGPVTPEEQEEQTQSSIRQLAGVERNSAEDDLSPDAQDNPFRYEGHYANADGTYDMQARAYRPAIGRFLSEDRFEAARGDFDLQADPLTQNRYAFAGGNPINNIEFDGHEPSSSFKDPCDAMYGSRSRCLNQKRGRAKLAAAKKSAAKAQRGAAKSGVELSTPRWLQSRAHQRAQAQALETRIRREGPQAAFSPQEQDQILSAVEDEANPKGIEGALDGGPPMDASFNREGEIEVKPRYMQMGPRMPGFLKKALGIGRNAAQIARVARAYSPRALIGLRRSYNRDVANIPGQARQKLASGEFSSKREAAEWAFNARRATTAHYKMKTPEKARDVIFRYNKGRDGYDQWGMTPGGAARKYGNDWDAMISGAGRVDGRLGLLGQAGPRPRGGP